MRVGMLAGIGGVVLVAMIACSQYGSEEPAPPTTNGEPDATVADDGPPPSVPCAGRVCGSVNGIGQCQDGKCVFVCNAGFAHCGDDAAGCDTETGSNPAACGACGHSCLGGTCSGGKCAPVAIVNGAGTPYAIAVDATKVYWTDQTLGVVSSCPIDGCGADGPDEVATIASASEIALDANAVYVSAGTSIRRCSLPSCGATSTQLAAAPQLTGLAPPFLFVDGPSVFFASTQDGKIYRVATNGLSPREELAVTDLIPRMVVKGAGSLYVSTAMPAGGQEDVQIRRCPLAGCPDGGAPEEVAASSVPITRIAGSVDGVYWATSFTGAIQACLEATCTTKAPITLATAQESPNDLVVDGDTLFWVNRGAVNASTGAVRSCKTASCTSTVRDLATGRAKPSRLAVTPTAVVWIEDGSKSIFRIAR